MGSPRALREALARSFAFRQPSFYDPGSKQKREKFLLSVGLEREVKFRVNSWEVGEQLLAAIGAEIREPRYFEVNTLFDFPSSALQEKGQALRVRRARGEAWLTFKGPVRGRGRFKERLEYETPVGDPEALEEALRELGLVERFRYEKYRAVYRLGDLLVTLDESPIGFYLEIEGSPQAIEGAAQKLGLGMEYAVALSYPRLYEVYREGKPGAPEHMVFSKKKEGSG